MTQDRALAGAATATTHGNEPGARVDLRSDTVTRPSAGMREAMMNAAVGDDGFRDDPTLIELEERVASTLHVEAALFVPSGVMANQIALRLHTQPGDEVIAHRRSHVVNHEAGAPAALAGVTLRLLDSDEGILYADDVRENLRIGEDGHLAPTTLICFENPHNGCGGVVVPQNNVLGVAAYAHRRGIRLHLDGARLWNAAVASSRSVGELAAPFDTVAVCLSKSLGCPVGSLIAGRRDDMNRARRLRRMMGGMMRQAGLLAAAGLYALDHHVERLVDDHRRAQTLAEEIHVATGLPVQTPQTNIVYLDIPRGHGLRIGRDNGEPGLRQRLADRGVLTTGTDDRVRLVTHMDIDDEDIEQAAEAVHHVFENYR